LSGMQMRYNWAQKKEADAEAVRLSGMQMRYNWAQKKEADAEARANSSALFRSSGAQMRYNWAQQAGIDRYESAQVLKNVAFAAPAAETELARLTSQVKKLREVQALIDAGRPDLAVKKFGQAAIDSVGGISALQSRIDSLRMSNEKMGVSADSAAQALRRQAAAVEAQLRFNAPSNLTSRGRDRYVAQGLASNLGRDEASALLGKKSFLLDLTGPLEAHPEKVRKAIASHQDLNAVMRDGHSAARGLAGSLGAMWLTWGNTAPLVAGAAIGGMFKSVISVGKDVEYQLAFVSALTGDAALSNRQFTESLQGGMVAPKEAAEAMRGLAQNGLNTRDALAALPSVLALATAGEMSLADAALGATGVLTAFGLGINDIGRVSDVFAKAASVSNTSVSAMVEAMKQASSVAEKYDVSLVDVSASLAVMAKRNIEGSAAGTAFRNAMKELATPTKAAAAAMAAVGIEAYDTHGKLKPYEELLTHVKDQLKGLNQESRLAFMDKIFGERGSKPMDAILSNMNDFLRLRKEIEEGSDGFTKSVVDTLGASTEGRIKTTMATFKSSVAGAFEDAKSPVNSFILTLESAFASKEFQSGVGNLVSNLANLSGMLLRNADVLALVGTGYMGMKVGLAAATAAQGVYTTAQTLFNAVVGRTVVTQAAQNAALATTTAEGALAATSMGTVAGTTVAAGTAATGASVAFRVLSASLGVIGLVLAAGATAWAIFGDNAKSAGDKAKDAADETARALDQAARAQQDSLRRQEKNLEYLTARNNWLKANSGRSTQDYDDFVKGPEASAQSKVVMERTKAVADAQRLLTEAEAKSTGRADANVSKLRETLRTEKKSLEDAQSLLKGAQDGFDNTKRQALAGGMGDNRNAILAHNNKMRDAAENSKALAKNLSSVLVPESIEGDTTEAVRKAIKAAEETANKYLESKKLPDRESTGRRTRDTGAYEEGLRRAGFENELALLKDRLKDERALLSDNEAVAKADRLRNVLDEQSYQDRLNEIRVQSLTRQQSLMEQERQVVGKTINTLIGRNPALAADDIVAQVNAVVANGKDDLTQVKQLAELVPMSVGITEKGRQAVAKDLLTLTRTFTASTADLRGARRDILVAAAEAEGGKAEGLRKDEKAMRDILRSSDDVINGLVERGAKARAKGEAQGVDKVQDEIEAAALAIDNTATKRLETLDAEIDALRKRGAAQFTEANRYQAEADNLSKRQAEATGTAATRLLEQAKEAQAKADEAVARGAKYFGQAGTLANKKDEVSAAGRGAKDAETQAAKDRFVQNFIDKVPKEPSLGLSGDGKAVFNASEALKGLLDLQVQYADAVKMAAGNYEKLSQVEQAYNSQRLAGVGIMLSSLKATAKEGGKTYAGLAQAEKAARIIQIAETLRTHALKLGLMWAEASEKVAAEGVKSGAVLASEASQTGATAAGSAARAAAQGPEVMMRFLAQLGPWGMAAGAAAITAVLGATVGSTGSFAPTNKGTGKVAGDKDKGSESLSRSLDALKEVDTLTMRYSAGMLASLRNIENGMKGLALSLYGSGTGNPVAQGVQTGTKFDRVGGATVGQVAGFLLGGPIGSLVGTAVGAVIDKIPVLGAVANFIAGKKTKVDGQGITASDKSLGEIRNGGLDASYYADVTTSNKVLGITYKSKKSTITQAVDSELDRQLSAVFTSIGDSVLLAAKQSGMNATEAQALINSSVISIGKIDTSGTAEEIQARLNNAISAEADKVARTVIPGLDGFTQVGEGYFETTVRVTSAVEQAEAALASLGITSVALAEIENKRGDVAAELVRDSILRQDAYASATGSLSDLAKVVEGMDGSAEEITQTYKSLLAVRYSLQGIGLTSVDASTALLKGAGGLDALTSAVDAYESNILTDTERLAAQSLKVRSAFTALGLATPKTIEEFKALVKSLDTASEADQELLGHVLGLSDSFSSLTSAIKELGSSVESEINRIKGLITSTSGGGFASLQSQFAIKTAQARAGDPDALDALADISQNLLAAGEKQAVTRADLLLLQARTAASLQETLDIVRAAATATPPTTVPTTAAAVTAAAASTSFSGWGSWMSGVPAFASGGYHVGGLRIVGENGPELEATGQAMYYNADETRQILSGGRAEAGASVVDSLVAVIGELRAEIATLREDQRAQSLALIRSTSRTATILETVTQGGDALTVRPAK
jgi:TP901 family phage tail tape measure protein